MEDPNAEILAIVEELRLANAVLRAAVEYEASIQQLCEDAQEAVRVARSATDALHKKLRAAV